MRALASMKHSPQFISAKIFGLAKSTGHIPELDGLRGIAILGVMLHHSQGELTRSHLDFLGRYGWIGVNLFFTLSGFLITRILLTSKQKPNFFRHFYARR